MVELSDQFGKPYFTKGGQGKFFQDPKPVDQHRYQRGYTPDRMAEVKGMSLTHLQSEDSVPGAAFSGPAGTHRLHEVIARSQTPYEEHSRLDLMLKHGVQRPLGIVTGEELPNMHGFYHPMSRGESGMVAISAHEGDEERAGQTLLHEMGHFRSHKIEKNIHSIYKDDPRSRGQEEAFADDNRMSRWRPDPRDVRKGRSKPVESAYEMGALTGSPMGQQFDNAYLASRRTSFGENVKSAYRQVLHERKTGITNATQASFDV